MNRPTWHKIWMDFAHSIACRSPDAKHQVGAVIVTEDNTQVLSIGYNGDHKGGPNERDSMDHGRSGFIHAEVNALIKCDYNVHKKKIMYLTLSPCSVCAKCIINAGIFKVVYDEPYTNDMSGLQLLKDCGIIVEKYNASE